MKECDRQNATMTALALSPIFEHAFKCDVSVKTEVYDDECASVATDGGAGDKGVNSLPTILDGELFRVLAQDGDRISAQCCQCPPNKKPIRGTRLSTGNFLSHLLRVHPDMKNRVQEKRKEKRGMKRQFSEPDVDRSPVDPYMIQCMFPTTKVFKPANLQTYTLNRSITLSQIQPSPGTSTTPVQQVPSNPHQDTDPGGRGASQNPCGAINVVPLHALTTPSNGIASDDASDPDQKRSSAEDRLTAALEKKVAAEEAIAKALMERARVEDAMTAALVKRAKAEEAIADALERRAKAEEAMSDILERRAKVEQDIGLAMERKV